MFEDFVEHSGQQTQAVPPRLEHKGFENPSQEQTTQGVSSNAQLPTDEPIFELGSVQLPGGVPATILSLAVSSDMMVVAFANNLLLILDLRNPTQVVRVEIGKKPSDFTVHRLFLDPSGRHLLINSTQGETLYLYKGWKKPKPLKRFSSSKIIIESIAWNRHAALGTRRVMLSGEFLIGTSNGGIWEASLDAEEEFFKSQEKFLRLVHTLPDRHAVTSIFFEYFPPSDSRKCLVLAATTSRLYQFVGVPDRRSSDGGDIFTSFFAKYREVAPVAFDIPAQNEHSELHTWNLNPSTEALSSSMCWLTGQGLYHGNLNFKSSSEDFIEGPQLLPYPVTANEQLQTQQEIPLSIALTEFHFLLLYPNRIVAVRSLDKVVTYQELLPLSSGEYATQLVTDPIQKTYWIHTNQAILEFTTQNEERDIWAAYLRAGDYEQALKKTNVAHQRDRILAIQAAAHFTAGRFMQAARCYAQSTVPFEEVALKFVDIHQSDALQYYLISRLEGTRKAEPLQRMMLATWLVELYLNKYNKLEDAITAGSLSQNVEDIRTELRLLDEEFRLFLSTYKDDLDKGSTYELIRSHGRTSIYLHFATLSGDHDKVIRHWIHEQDWSKVIDILSRQGNTELCYEHSPLLMEKCPKEIVDAWLRLPSLEPTRLIPAILPTLQPSRNEGTPRSLQSSQALRYINHVIHGGGNTSPVIHNLAITLHAVSAPEIDTSLLKHLSTVPANPFSGKPYYDLDYALRLCKKHELVQSCVYLYSQMGFWEECVELALAKGEVELAKKNANMPVDDPTLRKKLWMKIAKFVVQEQNDIKSAMEFVEAADTLKIEDILHLFPDFVVIDDFKDEICRALESYNQHIELLKSGMDEATRNAESIKEDIADLNHRFITLDSEDICSSCGESLFTRQFYAFPCQHTFHVNCLVSLVKDVQPPHVLRRIVALQNELMPPTTERSRQLMNGVKHEDTSGNSAAGYPRTLLSTNFVPNGRAVVNAAGSLGRGFITAGDKLRDLIVPESLATVVGGWTGGIAGLQTDAGTLPSKDKEKLREELDHLLASSCPLCDAAVLGLDKPFVEGDLSVGWDI